MPKTPDRWLQAAAKCDWVKIQHPQCEVHIKVHFLQLRGGEIGDRGRCPDIMAGTDSRAGTWMVVDRRSEVRGKGALPSPIEAIALLRAARSGTKGGSRNRIIGVGLTGSAKRKPTFIRLP